MSPNFFRQNHSRIRCFGFASGLFLLLLVLQRDAGGQQASGKPTKVDFNRDIRPILSNHCFQCHGADEESRAANLRLDVRESAVEHGAIDVNTPDKSSLVARILATDPEERMPPAETNKPLTEQQIGLLKQWVAEGAEYQDHWAFRRVERPAVPMIENDTWSRNEIDRFILQRLQQSDLQPSPAADSATLIRRATQDVLGLLPTVEEAKLLGGLCS
jgi:hypothetical protein